MVFLSTKTKVLVLIAIVCICILILIWNPSFSTSYESRGKILPKKVFLLRTNASGGLESFVVNNQSGQVEKYSVHNFDRGDIVEFNLPGNRNEVSKGDTLGLVTSNLFSNKINEINFTLTELEGDLEILASSEKEEIIEEMKLQVSLAEQQVETQKKIYERAGKLLERELISKEDFEIIEGQLELYRIEVLIAEEILSAALSGSKEEEIEAVKQKIKAAQKIKNKLSERLEKLKIISPLAGKLQTYANNDTLLTVNSTGEYILTLPVPVSNLSKIGKGDKITVNTEYGDITVTIGTIEEYIFYYGGNPFFKIVSQSFAMEEPLPVNSIINCTIEFGNVDLITYLNNIIN